MHVFEYACFRYDSSIGWHPIRSLVLRDKLIINRHPLYWRWNCPKSEVEDFIGNGGFIALLLHSNSLYICQPNEGRAITKIAPHFLSSRFCFSF